MTSVNGNGNEIDANLPPSQRSSWTSFLKSIASFTGDLYSLTAPPFILSPISLTEFPAYWCERPDLFAEIAGGRTEEDRALRVLKWFISTLKGQYTTRNEKLGSEKKPLNPVLGELFYGHWPDRGGRGRTELIVEQVSHHPPITAYYISNKTKGLELQGHNAQKTAFSKASIIVKQIGHAILTLNLPNGAGKETYLVTFPRLVIAGLLIASPYIELTETSYIASSTGYLSTIEYSGKGYFSGKAHTFKATVTKPSVNPSLPLYVFEGQWDTISRDAKTGEEFTNVTTPKEEVAVAPVEQQKDEFESRRLWKKVADGIRSGDFDTASREKTKIENEQRQRRREEQARGEKWPLRHFRREENDPEYEKLGRVFNANPPVEDRYVFLKNEPEFLWRE
ncbi:KES1 [Sanghuangporus weigelae]